MKICPNCNSPVEDSSLYCANCGTAVPNPQTSQQDSQQSNAYQGQGYGQQPPYGQAYGGYAQNGYGAPMVDPYDHTAEFDAKDISDNKVYCMLMYLMGVMGIIVALLASEDSKYVKFHLRQAMKLTVTQLLLSICAVVGVITIVVPLAAAVMIIVLKVIQIICFFQICKGKAKEPAIVRSLGFLK